MADETKKPKLDKDEKDTMRSVGRALWRLELPAQATVEEKKGKWSENHRKYMSDAKKLVRALAKEDVSLVKQPSTSKKRGAANADADTAASTGETSDA